MDAIKQIQRQLLERFNQLKRKEQYYVAALLILLLPYVFYMLLWQPVAADNKQLKQANAQAQQQLQSVQQLAAKYKQLSSTGSHNTEVNLPQLIDSSLLRHKLRLKRMQPSASGDIQLRFEDVSFNDLVAWLHELESEYAVIVKDASITPGNSDGVVSSSVRIRKG